MLGNTAVHCDVLDVTISIELNCIRRLFQDSGGATRISIKSWHWHWMVWMVSQTASSKNNVWSILTGIGMIKVNEKIIMCISNEHVDIDLWSQHWICEVAWHQPVTQMLTNSALCPIMSHFTKNVSPITSHKLPSNCSNCAAACCWRLVPVTVKIKGKDEIEKSYFNVIATLSCSELSQCQI